MDNPSCSFGLIIGDEGNKFNNTDNRRTLMFTYVFAYYLKKNNQSEIFEVMK